MGSLDQEGRVIINRGHSPKIMSACGPLREYAGFIARVQELQIAANLESAIDQAIEEMPDTFAVKRYLEAHKSKVQERLTTEYSEKKQMELKMADKKGKPAGQPD